MCWQKTYHVKGGKEERRKKEDCKGSTEEANVPQYSQNRHASQRKRIQFSLHFYNEIDILFHSFLQFITSTISIYRMILTTLKG